MIIRLQIIINKIIYLLTKLANKIAPLTFGNFKELLSRDGSVTPGYYALKLNSNVLNELTYPPLVIGVTGSTGKGSTVRLIHSALKEAGYKVITNESGSNMKNGMATLILNNTSILNKKVKADVALLEFDEAFIKESLEVGTLTHLVITNITRDQVTRNIEPDYMLDKITESYDERTNIILNADDAILNKVKYNFDGNVKTFGINKTKDSYKEPNYLSLDSVYCPLCDDKLNYEYYHYAHLGNYKCPSCNFKREVNYEGNNINLIDETMVIDKKVYNLKNNFLYSAYNTLAAYSLLKEINIDEEYILKGINKKEDDEVNNIYKYNNKTINVMTTKNENNVSFEQTLNFLKNLDKDITLVLGFDKVSRRYNYNNMAWIYDIDFSLINKEHIKTIYIFGKLKYNIKLALLNSNVDKNKIKLINKDIFNHIEEDLDIYIAAPFEEIVYLNKLSEKVSKK